MKKFLSLSLALVLALGLAAPAMAFTNDDSTAVDHPYDLSIYLIEYEDNDLFGFATLPASDRGYAKNEIVAAIAELYVPKDEKILPDEYGTLVLGGDNVSLNVTDNYKSGSIKLHTTSNIVGGTNVDTPAALNSDGEIVLDILSLAGKNTFKWMFFAKVTDDDASLYAKLIDGDGNLKFTGPASNSSLQVTLDGTKYTITKSGVGTDDGYYQISGDGDIIKLFVDKKYKSVGMSIDPSGATGEYNLGVNTSKQLGIVSGSKVLTSGHDYDDVMDVYEDVVEDVFGLDYFLIGNYLRDSFFEKLISSDTITATVDIEPYTAHVTIPDEVIVNPPKTGDAASILGFVMLTLSAGGAVALRKRN